MHDVYAKKDGIWGKILGNKGYNIDMVNLEFLNRNGGRPRVGFHRLTREHDHFSIGHGDNPFSILTE